MTLSFYRDYQELFQNAVLWWQGVDETTTGFPIIPTGVTATPAGTWTKDDLGTNKSVMKFDGSTNYISLLDDVAWAMFEGDFTIAGWFNFSSVSVLNAIMGQKADENNKWFIYTNNATNTIIILGISGGTTNFYYNCPFTPIASTWYYITIIRSGSTCLMYIDGVNKTVTATQAWRNTTNIAAVLAIGNADSGGAYTHGNIKDLLIYKGRALDLPTLTTIMRKTNPASETGLYPIQPGVRSCQ